MTTSTAEQRRATAARRPHVQLWLAWFLRCLTSAWLATAFMYALSLGTLPEPIVALATAVVLAAVVATALVVVALEPAGVAARPRALEPPPTAQHQDAFIAPHRPAPTVRPTQPDALAAHLGGEPGARQCPRCGSFAVTVGQDPPPRSNACRVCGQVWQSGAGVPEPDVVVRSWLHREE